MPPKKPYSFLAMLDDILHFASETLVDDGRLSFWMPTANDEAQEIATPQHPSLEIVATCVQPFRKWSRRLLTYRKRPDGDVRPADLARWAAARAEHAAAGTNGGGAAGVTADELNPFRKGYFKGFQKEEAETATP